VHLGGCGVFCFFFGLFFCVGKMEEIGKFGVEKNKNVDFLDDNE
jgi:hypothetical protein